LALSRYTIFSRPIQFFAFFEACSLAKQIPYKLNRRIALDFAFFNDKQV